jgi:hypothetical protein
VRVTSIALDTQPGTVLPAEPAAPTILHVDVAECVRDLETPSRATPMPHPERDAMELQLLAAAKDCAAGGTQLPRRELVAVALREAERQQWWRDQAEAEKEALRQQLDLTQAHAAKLQELRTQQRQLLGLFFEIVAWAAHQLGCEPSGKAVLKAIRAFGSGWLQHETQGDEADRLRAEVAHG